MNHAARKQDTAAPGGVERRYKNLLARNLLDDSDALTPDEEAEMLRLDALVDAAGATTPRPSLAGWNPESETEFKD